MPGVAVVTGAGRGFGREIAKRLANRGYTVLATDIDGDAAAATAEQIGGFSMQVDVRDPEAHRRAARAAAERGPLEVWVNNAGVLRTQKVWDQPDDEIRLIAEINMLGVIWGSRAAVDAMRSGGGQNMHVINLGSMSALTPVPGLAVYAATKHAVWGFTASLQGELMAAGVPIDMHVVCPDGADTDMTRERAAEPESAIIWSARGCSRRRRSRPRWCACSTRSGCSSRYRAGAVGPRESRRLPVAQRCACPSSRANRGSASARGVRVRT